MNTSILELLDSKELRILIKKEKASPLADRSMIKVYNNVLIKKEQEESKR